MTPPQEVDRLASAFAGLLERSGLGLAAASEKLGRHPTYLGRVLRRQTPFKVAVALQLLEILEVDPEEFFCALYPLGGVRVGTFTPSELGCRGEAVARELLLAQREALIGRPRDVRAWVLRCGEVLRQLLRRRGMSQKEASRRLSLGPGALGQLLRGFAGLNLEHVFALLALLDASPGRFFLEMFRPGGSALASVLWAEYLDEVDAGWRAAAARLGPLAPGGGG